MIEFYSETDFQLENKAEIKKWISEVIISEGYEVGNIIYIFCDDEYLHKLNVEFLDHDTLTDILSFDYCLGKEINGEVYISIERVMDNATDFKTHFHNELHRVIIHGIFHFCGYKDKTDVEEKLMREKESSALHSLSQM
ncbi:rRNA maturation RNase YbeY [Aequorivita lipolytica]|uniref:Endoribonuclease YbeY n=1 Tax=Aequorivita lipolytica TaxID=153267 RepID=A0A5C6YT54_9FLAO|nr:rRNA maturation RNase YbeY [Aequorivita lipolytica]TXD70262.1 rRNA maturation RNase YbeY [Aequorivita lipolytica]SRX50687.1 Endoribonuclease YbeY [Aequorivita lipolytica]